MRSSNDSPHILTGFLAQDTRSVRQMFAVSETMASFALRDGLDEPCSMAVSLRGRAGCSAVVRPGARVTGTVGADVDGSPTC